VNVIPEYLPPEDGFIKSDENGNIVPPDKDEMKELYAWWDLPDNLKTHQTSFLYFKFFDGNYIDAVDAALMFMSKGGITLDNLQKMGPRSKGRRLKPLQDIFRLFYGGGKKQDGESEEVTPTEM